MYKNILYVVGVTKLVRTWETLMASVPPNTTRKSSIILPFPLTWIRVEDIFDVRM